MEPSSEPYDPWDQPQSGGRRRAPEDYDQPTGFLRQPEAARPRPEPRVYGRQQPPPEEQPPPPAYNEDPERTWAGSSLGMRPTDRDRYTEQQQQPPQPGGRRRRRELNEERAWQEPRREEWSEPRRHDEWLDVPHGGREPQPRPGRTYRSAQPAPDDRTGQQPVVDHGTGERPPVDYRTGERPQVEHRTGERPQVDYGSGERPVVDYGSGERPQVDYRSGEQPLVDGGGKRGRRAEDRSRSDRSRHEREHSSRRIMTTVMITAALALVLVLAGGGYWFFLRADAPVDDGRSITGVTVPGIMDKAKGMGFTCLTPGSTAARCEKQVSGVTFSIGLRFTDDTHVTAIIANGGTGSQSQATVAEADLRNFFALAAQFPFADTPDAAVKAKTWVDTNLRKEGKIDMSGITYETANGQDIVTIYTKKPTQ